MGRSMAMREASLHPEALRLPGSAGPAGSREGVGSGDLRCLLPPTQGLGGQRGEGQAHPPSLPDQFLLWTRHFLPPRLAELATGPLPPAPRPGTDRMGCGPGPTRRPVLAALSRPCPAWDPGRGSLTERLCGRAELLGWEWAGRGKGGAGSLWRVRHLEAKMGRTWRSPGQLPAQQAPAPSSPTDGCTVLLARPVIDGLVTREPGDNGESWTCSLASEGSGSHSYRRDLAPQTPPTPPPPCPTRRTATAQTAAGSAGPESRCLMLHPCPVLPPGPLTGSNRGCWWPEPSRGLLCRTVVCVHSQSGQEAGRSRSAGKRSPRGRRAALALACPSTLVCPSVPAPAPAAFRGPVQGRLTGAVCAGGRCAAPALRAPLSTPQCHGPSARPCLVPAEDPAWTPAPVPGV